MANQFQQTADDARRLLRGFKAIETLAAAFEDVAVLETTKTEVESKLLQVREAVATAETELQAIQFSASEVAAQSALALENTKAQVEAALSEAQNKAAAIVSEAQTKAAGVEAALAERVAEAEAKVAEAQTAYTQIQTDTDGLEAKLTRLKTQAAKLLG